MASDFGARIKAARLRLDIALVDFADCVGVSRATQANYEAGKTVPTLEYLEQCCKIGISVSELVDIAGASNVLDDGDVAVQLHDIIERHTPAMRNGKSSAPLYAALWALFQNAHVRDEADVKMAGTASHERQRTRSQKPASGRRSRAVR